MKNMKLFFRSILCFAMLLVFASFLVGCVDDYPAEEVVEHSHAYDQEVAEDEYLKTPATCEEKAVYYKSCVCGEKGEKTFEYGEVLSHTYDQEIVKDEYLKTPATCEEKAVYYKSCVCGEKGEKTFDYGEVLSHAYDQEVAEDEYLKTPATCEEKAVYYKSCVCGEKGEETFNYGEVLSHTFDQEVAKDEYLKAPATCEEEAVYYKSCVCGEKGEETFDYGEVLGHDYTSENAKVVWTWAEDYSEAVAKFICGRDETHFEEIDATITSKTTKASCNSDGKIVYIATVEINGEKYTDGKTVKLEKSTEYHHKSTKRRNIKEPTYDEEGYTGEFYCTRCKETLEKGDIIPKLGLLSQEQIQELLTKNYTLINLNEDYAFTCSNIRDVYSTYIIYQAEAKRFDIMQSSVDYITKQISFSETYLQKVGEEYRYSKIDYTPNSRPLEAQYVVIDETNYNKYVGYYTNQNELSMLKDILDRIEDFKKEIEYYLGEDAWYLTKTAQRRDDNLTYITIEFPSIYSYAKFTYSIDELETVNEAYDSVVDITYKIIIDEETNTILSSKVEVINEFGDSVLDIQILERDDELISNFHTIDYLEPKNDISIKMIDFVDAYNCVDTQSEEFTFFESQLTYLFERYGFFPSSLKYFYPVDSDLFDIKLTLLSQLENINEEIYLGYPLDIESDLNLVQDLVLKVEVVEKDGINILENSYTLNVNGVVKQFYDIQIGEATFGELKQKIGNDIYFAHIQFVGWSLEENGAIIEDNEIIAGGTTLYSVVKDTETTLTVYGIDGCITEFALQSYPYNPEYVVIDGDKQYFIAEYSVAGCDFEAYYYDENFVNAVPFKILTVGENIVIGYLIQKGEHNVFYAKMKTYTVSFIDPRLGDDDLGLVYTYKLHHYFESISVNGFDNQIYQDMRIFASVVFNNGYWQLEDGGIEGFYLDRNFYTDYTSIYNQNFLPENGNINIYVKTSAPLMTFASVSHAMALNDGSASKYVSYFKVFYDFDFDFFKNIETSNVYRWQVDEGYDIVGLYLDKDYKTPLTEFPNENVVIYPKVEKLEQQINGLKYQRLDANSKLYTITGIDENFEGTEIVIPKYIEDGIVFKIDSGAFVNNTKITKVVLPSTIIAIASSAFSGCTSLKEVVMTDSVQTIGAQAFLDCISLENIRLSDNLTKLGKYVFCRCLSLVSIKLPDGLSVVPPVAFAHCENLKEVEFGKGVRIICENAFQYCRSLEEIRIPANVQRIEYGVFTGCENLCNITLEEGVKEIYEVAFYGCGIKTITLPSSLTRIDEGAFTQCKNLEEVIFSNTSGWIKTTENGLTGESVDFTNSNKNVNKLQIQRHFIYYCGSREIALDGAREIDFIINKTDDKRTIIDNLQGETKFYFDMPTLELNQKQGFFMQIYGNNNQKPLDLDEYILKVYCISGVSKIDVTEFFEYKQDARIYAYSDQSFIYPLFEGKTLVFEISSNVDYNIFFEYGQYYEN